MSTTTTAHAPEVVEAVARAIADTLGLGWDHHEADPADVYVRAAHAALDASDRTETAEHAETPTA